MNAFCKVGLPTATYQSALTRPAASINPRLLVLTIFLGTLVRCMFLGRSLHGFNAFFERLILLNRRLFHALFGPWFRRTILALFLTLLVLPVLARVMPTVMAMMLLMPRLSVLWLGWILRLWRIFPRCRLMLLLSAVLL